MFNIKDKIKNHSGSVLLELSLIIPILLLLISAIVQFGFVLNAKIAVNSAAYEAARAATISENPNGSAIYAIENYAKSSIPGWSFSERLRANIVIPNSNPGTEASVEVFYRVPLFFSKILPFDSSSSTSIEVKGKSVMRIEEKE